MGRKLSEVIAALPASRQQRIEALAQAKLRDMLAHAQTLGDIRAALGKTQQELAETLGVKQHAISQLERRSDIYLSTLKRFLRGMGMELQLVVVTAEGQRVELPDFRTGATTEAGDAAANDAALAARPKLPARRR